MGTARRAASGRGLPGKPGRRWLPVAAGAALLGSVLWIFLQGGGEEPTQPASATDALQPSAPKSDAPTPGAADLGPDAVLPIPGEGPIFVELRWLGGAAEEPLAPRSAGSLTGRVLAASDEPLSGVLLSVAGGPQDGWSVRSDAEGRFRFPELLPGTHDFRLQAPGRPTVVRRERILSRGPTRRDFVVGAPVPLEVVVRGAENEPVEGALVRADHGVAEARTDAAGNARLDGVPGGRVLVDVLADGLVPIRQEVLVRASLAGNESIELAPLQTGASVAGQVLSWPGGPLPRITAVPLADRPGDNVLWEAWHDVLPDETGRFELKNLPVTRTVTIRAFHPEGVANPRQRALRPDPNTTPFVRFVFQRGDRRVTGTVRGPDGAPLSGVQLVLETMDPLAVLGELYPGLTDGAVSTTLPVPAPLRREAVTGADGRFDFTVSDHLAGTGHLQLTAAKEGYAAVRERISTARPDMTLRLSPADRTGRVELHARGNAELPELRYFLDGRAVEGVPWLETGRYEVRIRRGEHLLADEPSVQVNGRVRFDLP